MDIVPEIKGIIDFPLMDKIKGEKDVYLLDLKKIPSWFEKVTLESLFAMLSQAGKSNLHSVEK